MPSPIVLTDICEYKSKPIYPRCNTCPIDNPNLSCTFYRPIPYQQKKSTDQNQTSSSKTQSTYQGQIIESRPLSRVEMFRKRWGRSYQK